MSQEHSAEFCRGAIWQWGKAAKLAELDDLLAEAEDREASVPTAAEVIAAAERERAALRDAVEAHWAELRGK